MWHLHSGKPIDSDQSISDEDEEQQSPWPENLASLGATFDRNKESLGVASQLELLKGVRQDVGFSSEDEVELPEFNNQSNVSRQCLVEGNYISLKRDDSTCEPDEQLSSVQNGNKALFKSITAGDNVSDRLNLYIRGKEKQTDNCSKSAIYRESKKINSGGRRKSVPKPSSHVELIKKGMQSLVQTDKDQNSTSSDELLEESEAIDSWPKEKTNHLEDLHDEGSLPRLASLEGAAMQPDTSGRSMAELLDHIQGQNSKPYEKCKTDARRKGRIRRHGTIRNLSSSLNTLISEEDADEFTNSGSSTDDEGIALDHKPDIVGSGRKTMADKFQDAFGSAPMLGARPFMAPKLSSSGLFGRLQQVMQRQKDQDTEFLKNQQTEVWPKDEAKCIDVKILSKSFDAKLTVCHCSVLENEESSVQNPHQENFQKTWTIIFNSRVCVDVDLEVGNLVRVHPPWKEVQVLRCGEIIILATYFSQM